MNPRVVALNQLWRAGERVWLVLLLTVTSGVYFGLVQHGMSAESDDLEARTVHPILLVLYVILGGIIITHPKGFTRMARRAWPALALVMLACVSTLWSVEPSLTLRRGISLLAPTAAGLIIALRLPPSKLLRLLALAFWMAAVVSVIVVLLLPEQGIMIRYDYAWRGIYQTKNSFGRAMALAVPVFALVALDAKRYRSLWWLSVAGALVLVVLSKSVGSLVPAVALLMLIPLFRSLRLRLTTAVLITTISVLLGAVLFIVIVANAEPVFALLGRDPTFTGRTAIWAAALVSIAERPWLGYGHNAFWQGWLGPSSSLVSSVGWEMQNSHNGLMDLWLELGSIGVLTFLVGLAIAVRAAIVTARQTNTAAGLWPLVFLSYLVLINVSMSTLLTPHSLYWILYVAVLSSGMRMISAERGAGVPGTDPRSGRFSERLEVPVSSRHVSPGIRRLPRRQQQPRG